MTFHVTVRCHRRRIKRATTFEDLLDAVATRDIGSFYFLVQDVEGWILVGAEVVRVDSLQGMFDPVAIPNGIHSNTTLWRQAFLYEWNSEFQVELFQKLEVSDVSKIKNISHTQYTFDIYYIYYTRTIIYLWFGTKTFIPP